MTSLINRIADYLTGLVVPPKGEVIDVEELLRKFHAEEEEEWDENE